jgi:hypothetical protein
MRRIPRFLTLATVAIAVSLAAAATLTGAGQTFYRDDPLMREPDTQDAKDAQPFEIDLVWDLALNLFGNPGDQTPNVKAQNVNTIDEVPDSSWFTNRIVAHPLSIDDAVRGPLTGEGPAPGTWTVVRPKEAGFAPGFTMRDAKGDIWFVSFDAHGYPEAATGAILVANKIFWALGYWQVENFLIDLDPKTLTIGETAMFTPPSGKKRPMRTSDLDAIFRRSNKSANGTYRAVAGRGLPGRVLGGFEYHNTRPDDPNDVVPHEHRRELRALKVFGAWTNLVDMKAGNTLDTVITENGRGVVRHYLQDVGSTFGTGANALREYDEGWEYLYEGGAMMKRLVSFGFYLAPWVTADYEDNDAIGRFEGDSFDPETWKPRVPTAAFRRARPDDTFWAARRVAAFSDDMIRAIVKTGRYSNPADEKLLSDVLIKRRDKIAQAYLTNINPLVDFALNASGGLTFTNAAVKAGVAQEPTGGYSVSWSSFDNTTGETKSLRSDSIGQTERVEAVPNLGGDGAYVKIQIKAMAGTDAWQKPVDVYFRNTGGEWKLVGVERMP